MGRSGETVTYGELNDRSNQLAQLWWDRGLRRGDHAAIFMENHPRFLEVAWAALRSGLYLTTVNSYLTADEVAYILRDSGAQAIFVGAEFAPVIEAARAELPGLRHVVVLGDEAGGFDAWRDAAPATAPAVPIDPESAAVQMYTSGTTGHPKGVVLSHRAMVNAAEAGLTVWPFLFEAGSAVLGTMLGDKDPAKANRVMQAMLKMVKIDIAKLKEAYDAG